MTVNSEKIAERTPENIGHDRQAILRVETDIKFTNNFRASYKNVGQRQNRKGTLKYRAETSIFFPKGQRVVLRIV